MNKLTDKELKFYLRNPNKKEELLKFLQEIEEENEKNKTEVDKKHDKIFKEILLNKEEASRFIYINFNVFVRPDELELCNSEFRTKNNKVLEVDILYKVKGKQLFFLIEHQTKVDKYMVYRILNYQTEIINRYKPKIGENKPAPIIMSAVIYTGKGKWTAKTNLGELQEDVENGVKLILGNEKNVGNYKVIDIKDSNKEELEKSNYVLDKACLFEQLEDVNEIISEFYMSYTKVKTENRELIEKVIKLILSREISDNAINDIIEIARIGGGDGKVLAMAQQVVRNQFAKNRREGIREGRKEGRKEGEKIGASKLIKELLKNNVDKDIIMKSAGISKKELEKIEEEIKEDTK